MLHTEFLEYLEFTINRAYIEKGMKDTKVWCKRVTYSHEDHNVEQVKASKQLFLKAYVDNYGRTEYDLCLKIGKKSLSGYLKGLNLKNNVPSYRDSDLISVDFDLKKIVIQLN